jgi:hypothetical protein
MTNEEVAELQAWFGVRGKFPAVHVGTAGQPCDPVAKTAAIVKTTRTPAKVFDFYMCKPFVGIYILL